MANRLALVIGNSIYRDGTLTRLMTPDADVGALADALLDTEIGGFDDVKLFVNMSFSSIRRAISDFFSKKGKDDLLLLYFSGHGVLDKNGRLYLAVKDTDSKLLRGTAIPANFITDEMNNSHSQRQILIMDCCHSGAFARGAKGTPGLSVGMANSFEGTGYGRVVLAASDATQYAWEGDEILGDAENSLFTHYLIRGLITGEADANLNGEITIDEMFDYVFENVVKQTPNQTPSKWTYKERGEIVIARASHHEERPVSRKVLVDDDEKLEAQLESLYLRGLGAFHLENWEKATKNFQTILDMRPNYKDAAAKLDEANTQKDLAHQYRQAVESTETKEWKTAISILESLVAESADYLDAAERLEKARKNLLLEDLYHEAQQLFEIENWSAVIRVFDKIFTIDPDFVDQEKLHGRAEQYRAQEIREQKVKGLYSLAFEKMDANLWEEALEYLEKVQELSPNFEDTRKLIVKIKSQISPQPESIPSRVPISERKDIHRDPSIDDRFHNVIGSGTLRPEFVKSLLTSVAGLIAPEPPTAKGRQLKVQRLGSGLLASGLTIIGFSLFILNIYPTNMGIYFSIAGLIFISGVLLYLLKKRWAELLIGMGMTMVIYCLTIFYIYITNLGPVFVLGGLILITSIGLLSLSRQTVSSD